MFQVLLCMAFVFGLFVVLGCGLFFARWNATRELPQLEKGLPTFKAFRDGAGGDTVPGTILNGLEPDLDADSAQEFYLIYQDKSFLLKKTGTNLICQSQAAVMQDENIIYLGEGNIRILTLKFQGKTTWLLRVVSSHPILLGKEKINQNEPKVVDPPVLIQSGQTIIQFEVRTTLKETRTPNANPDERPMPGISIKASVIKNEKKKEIVTGGRIIGVPKETPAPIAPWFNLPQELVELVQPSSARMIERIAQVATNKVVRQCQRDDLFSDNRCTIYLSPLDYQGLLKSINEYKLDDAFSKYLANQLLLLYKKGKDRIFLPAQLLVKIIPVQGWFGNFRIGSPMVELKNTIISDLHDFQEEYMVSLTSSQLIIDKDVFRSRYIIFGRGDDGIGNRIVLPDKTTSKISKKHACIEFDGREFWLRHLGRFTGTTLLDGDPIEPILPYRLNQSHSIRFGDPDLPDRQINVEFLKNAK